jgi:CHAT domain-containing protein
MAILDVEPHGTADLFGIKSGDVLLEYNGKVLNTMNDLAVVPADGKPIRVPVKLWRAGEVRSLEIAPGPLGTKSIADRPAAQVVLAQRAAAEILEPSLRGENLRSLPGTRREVQAVAALFPANHVTMLLGSEATESNLQRLAQSNALKSFRFVHLATHGKSNANVAMSSALFLASDPDRSADHLTLDTDGRITAQQIVNTWDLDADLVVLSACETGLGRYAGGEGYLGFTQALFVKGARSVVLSLWKVDDRATSLLMKRFYENLLGKRRDLKEPLPKAMALSEAKAWLRTQSVEDDPTTRSEPRKSNRGKGQATVTRFDHPYYWAGFVLVGDPS